MKPARSPPDRLAIGTMLLLCICWGFQQVAVKIVAADVAPIMQIGLRSGVAAIVFGVIVLHREGRSAFTDGTLWPGIAVGVLFGLEFLFVAEALVYTTAAHMAVFFYTAPVFTALGLHLSLPEERLRPRQWLGVLTAVGGIAVAMLGQRHAGASDVLVGDTLAILGGASWGAITVAIRRSALSEAAPEKTLFYQLIVGSMMLLAAAFAAHRERVVPSVPALLSLTFQVIVIALVSYLAWFRLLRRYLASRLSILSLMTPFFGVVFGVAILHERLTGAFVGGAALAVVGIAIVSGTELIGQNAGRIEQPAIMPQSHERC